MRKIVLIVATTCMLWTPAFLHAAAAPSPTPTSTPKKTPKAAGASNGTDKGKPDQKGSPGKGPAGDAMKTDEPVTTEIYSDQAFFDSNKSMGIFTGHVKVNDPRFNLQSDKLTVYITKGENQGLERAVAEGNVGVVRDRPDPNGGPPTRAIGRSDRANYIAATGDVELTGTPRVQQGPNTHIATSADTVMVINQQGQLTTTGPSRTDIRQEPKDDDEKGGDQDKDKDKKADNKDKKKNQTPTPTPTPKKKPPQAHMSKHGQQ